MPLARAGDNDEGVAGMCDLREGGAGGGFLELRLAGGGGGFLGCCCCC